MLSITPFKLFLFQFLAHLSVVGWCIWGDISSVNLLIIVVMYFLTGCVGMSVTYHRLLTHRSFVTSKWWEYFGTLCATIGLTGSSITWTATHRTHHLLADKVGDPHSPNIMGVLRAQWLSMWSPVNISKSPVIRSDFHRWIHRNYICINLLWALILFIIDGPQLVLVGWLIPAALLWNAGSLINTVCHTKWLGYRRYQVPDNSINNPILGVLMWGEGWHNNHHRFQNKPNIGKLWWEIDIGYYLIMLIKKK